jgi:hypothetical protein
VLYPHYVQLHGQTLAQLVGVAVAEAAVVLDTA